MRQSRPSARPNDPNGRPGDRRFSLRLNAWYRAHHRRLPWRERADPYAIWVSEVMLQQTTVPAVVPYFERWMRLFPDVTALARAPLEKVLRAWQGLGYYQRARNLHRAARILVRAHGATIPDDERVLGRLPGFGPYTTAAVLSLAYGRPLPVVDANVRRVLMRITGTPGEATPEKDKVLLEYIRGVFPARAAGLFNQALMELGALVCRTRNPHCLLCPVLEFCRSARDGYQELIPRPRKRPSQRIEAVIAVIQDRGRFLIQKRPPAGLFAGLWEFPGGKRRRGESPEDALRREVREEVGVDVRNIRYLTTVNQAYTQFKVTLRVFACELKRARPAARPGLLWVSLTSIRRYPLPSGSVKIINYLAGSRQDAQK